MATDFNKNIDVAPFGFRLESGDTPLDGRTRVETFNDISSIPNPFLGMQVFVKDSGELYLVKQIDEREAGLSVEYFINISTDEDKERSLARIASSDNIDSIVGPVEGVAYLTSYVFTKSTSVPAKPEGGCFTFPYPTLDGAATGVRDENWHDTVPSDGIGAVYMSYRTFCSDPAKSGEWTEPRKLADSANFQVEFTAIDLSKYPEYVISKFTGNEASWRQTEKNKGVIWGDDTDIENPIYMATAVCHNDVWENWTVIKIKGEKGDKGDKGESAKVSFRGKFSDLEKMVAEWDVYRADKENYSPDYDTNRFLLPLEVGDGYIVETNGCLYVYNGEDSEFDAVWTNVGQIKGESAYLYVRYSNDSNGANMWDPADNPTPGKYIGIKASELPLNDDDLLNSATFAPWTLWRGEDGWGYEQVFLLTHKTNGGYSETYGPEIPKDREDTPDYLPKHGISESNVKGSVSDNTKWSDRPLSTSETWPLCWVVTRKVGKEYTDWKGDANGRAILYSKYSVDGLPGSSPIFLELTNDRADIPLENGVIDPEFKETQSVTTTMKLFEGMSRLTNGVTYRINPTSAGTVDGATVTLNLDNLTNINEVECIATYNKKDYSRNFKIYKTNNAYEIIPSEYILVKNEGGTIVSTDTLTVEVKKWDSLNNKWIVPTDKTLFVKYYFDGATSPEVVSKTINNSISVDLKTNLVAIRFYITDDNNEDSDEITHEQVGVIANVNGVDGATYKTAYAFTRCADDEIANVTLSGGDWDEPWPNSTALNGKTYEWTDTVPEGEDAIWVATRQFKEFDTTFDKTWSSPRKMSDSADFEVEFSAGLTKEDGTVDIETKPTLKSLNGFADIDAWKADSQHKDWNWVDGSQAAGTIWMATSVKHGATWTDWTVVKIKGEKGERGADGTSVNIKGTVNSEEELYAIQNPAVGDGYILGEDLWIYTEEGVWKNVGPIKGPAGSSMYLYVRCSDTEGNPKKLLDEGETGKYIGYHVSLDVLDDDELQKVANEGKFTWTKWTGEDGWGYEQIYLLTTGAGYAFDKGPQINGNDWYNDPSQDFLPEHRLGTEAIGGADDYERWSDVPLVPTEDYPYCWELKRKVSGLVDGKWTNCGNWMTDAGGRAILYDRYVSDGLSSVHLELSNSLAIVPCDEEGNVDENLDTDLASTGLQLYEGGVAVPDDKVTYSFVEGTGFTAKCEDKTVTITSLTNDYVLVACKAKYNNKDYFKNFRVQKRDSAWRLVITGSNVIRKTYDSDGNLQIINDPFGFKVEKWNDVKWSEDTTKKIFIAYSINGEQTITTATNNAYDFSVVDVNASDFRAFITDNNLKDGVILDTEHIGFIIDGKDGENGKDTYSIELTNDLGIIPLESNGDIDKQAEDITTQIIMLKGNTVINKDDNVTYSINVSTSNAIEFNSATGLLTIHPANFVSASDIPSTIECTAQHGNVTLKKTFHLNVTKNAYELIPHKHMLQRDLSTGLLVEDDQTLNVSIRKWNATTNVWETPTQTLYVHVDCEHIGTPNHTTTNVYNSTNSGEITLDLSNEKELKSIRLYLSTTNSLSDAKTNHLTYENLGVYANGEDGSEIEFIYYLTDKEELPLNPTPKSTNLSNNSNYQISEWTPSKYLELIDSSTYTNKDESVITTAIAAKWTDNPQGVSETIPYQYVAQRRKIGGFWEAFSTPTLWSSYGQKGEQGEQGSPGSDAIVTQLTNPASIIMIVDEAFAQTTVSTGLQVRKGSEFVQVTDVTIYKGWLDGVESDSPTYYLASITPELDTTSEYSDNNLVFTIRNNALEVKPHVIKLRLKIVTTEGTFYEDKTINILESGKSGENAVHLELIEDFINITFSSINNQNGNLGITNKAVLYNGTIEADGETYSAIFENCEGTCNESTGEIVVNYINPDLFTKGKVIVTATFKGIPYQKAFIIEKTTSNWKLQFNQNVINLDAPVDIVGSLSVDGFIWKTLDDGMSIKYSINDGDFTEVSYSNSEFTIPVATVTKNVTVELHYVNEEGTDLIFDKETIGVVENGSNAEYYQIEVNHSWVVKDQYGEVKVPNAEFIEPYVYYINGSDKTKITLDELDALGYRIDYILDGSSYIPNVTEAVDPSIITKQIVFYLLEKNADTTPIQLDWIDYVEVDVVNEIPGEPGVDGSSGPVIYPAGEYTSGVTYTGNAQKAPYVYVKGDSANEYYIAFGTLTTSPNSSTALDSNVSLDWSNPTNEWIKMESYSAIYSDIGVFNHALVGKWVFHGDYMFSQDGVLGYDSNTYELYIPAGIGQGTKTGQTCSYIAGMNPTIAYLSSGPNNIEIIREMSLWERIENNIWIPNICFNAVTGEGWFAGKKVYFNESGDLTVGYFKVDDNGFKYESPDGNIIYFSKEGLIISDSNNSSKSAIKCDGSGYLANEAISWTTNGDLTIDGSIFNPITSDLSNCLNKTVCVDHDLVGARTISVGTYDSSGVSEDMPIKRIGSLTVISNNLEYPSWLHLSNAKLRISSIQADSNQQVLSQTSEYDHFIIAPGSTITFDIYDDFNHSTRYLRPKTQMGWFNRNKILYPCSYNTSSYEDLNSIVIKENSLGTSITGGSIYDIITLPEGLVKYMSIQMGSLNADYDSMICFQKHETEGAVTNAYSVSNISNTTYIKNSSVDFKSGGVFGLGAYYSGTISGLISTTILKIRLYDSTNMIGYFDVVV